jgi:hypothetical protein
MWGGSSGGWPGWGPSGRWPSWNGDPYSGSPPGSGPGSRPGWRPPPGDYRPGDRFPWESAPGTGAPRHGQRGRDAKPRRGVSSRSSPGGHPGFGDGSQQADPARYVGRLLAWQGAAWLVLAVIGLCVWLGTLPSGLVLGSPSGAMLWKSAELLAIAIGAVIGSAQASMACQLRGGRGLARAAAATLRGLTVASGLAAGAVGVLLVGSVMELIVLNGPLRAAVSLGGPAEWRRQKAPPSHTWRGLRLLSCVARIPPRTDTPAGCRSPAQPGRGAPAVHRRGPAR